MSSCLHQKNVMIPQVTRFMVKQRLGSQMIVLSVCVVIAHQSAWQPYAVIQTVKSLCILRDSAVLCAPWLTRPLQGRMKQVITHDLSYSFF